MSRSALRRIIEAFFHRWPYYVLLLVLAIAAGVVQVRRGTDQYMSIGSILTNGGSLVTAQSGLQNDPFFSALSPSQYTSQELIGLVFTDAFMDSVIANGEIESPDDPTSRAFFVQGLRNGLGIWPTSGTIVHVSATTPDPELSAALVESVMVEYLAFKRSVDVAEGGASERFFVDLVAPYQLELEQARAELDRALDSIDPEIGATAAQEREITRLTEDEQRADQRYQQALQSLENSRLLSRQVETDVEQSFTVLDRPEVAQVPLGQRFDEVLALAMYAMIGLLLMIAAPVFAALTNDVVVFDDDLDADLGVEILATIPRFRRRDLDTSNIAEEPPEPSPTEEPEGGPRGDFVGAGVGGSSIPGVDG